jgi:hypothetical protein
MMGNVILYIKLAALIFTYGLKLVKWFRERYEKVEKEAVVVAMTPDDKAKVFNQGTFNDVYAAKKTLLATPELNHIREKVWTAYNPGKQPKQLKDKRLRARRVGGKTSGRIIV